MVSKGVKSVADHTSTLKVGDTAPDFELKSHTGEMVRLSQYRGQRNVMIAFYPLAWTPV